NLLKSRRDGLFIEWQPTYDPILFVFQRRGLAGCNNSRPGSRAAEKQKEEGASCSVGYKQVIPTGFARRPNSAPSVQGPRSAEWSPNLGHPSGGGVGKPLVNGKGSHSFRQSEQVRSISFHAGFFVSDHSFEGSVIQCPLMTDSVGLGQENSILGGRAVLNFG